MSEFEVTDDAIVLIDYTSGAEQIIISKDACIEAYKKWITNGELKNLQDDGK